MFLDAKAALERKVERDVPDYPLRARIMILPLGCLRGGPNEHPRHRA
jgi:hypothetical protein